MQQRVAIVGAGLAGLASAYYLRDRFNVTVFEAERRVGGRIATSRTLKGEHGAEFVLGSEGPLRLLLNELRVPLDEVEDESWFRFDGHYSPGPATSAAAALLPRRSASRVIKLLNHARKWRFPSGSGQPDWLPRFLGHDRNALRFVSMLLAGETCGPLNHASAHDVLGSLYPDCWYRIRGGSYRLVAALHRRSGAQLRMNAIVTAVTPHDGAVRVTWRGQRGKVRTDAYSAVIVATPDGEKLAGEASSGHFHAYISVLLLFERAWWDEQPRYILEALRGGLYTDGPLNFIEQVPSGISRNPLLRILIPHAEAKLTCSDRRLVQFCVDNLRTLSQNTPDPSRWSVCRWRFGLPCGGKRTNVNLVHDGIYLAGDRLAEWPSMDGALRSGLKAANLLLRDLA